MKKTVLTGIKPTGQVHLGNYSGAIKPALNLAKNEDLEPIYFVADYHALTSVRDPKQMKEFSYGIAATWLALGLDPAKSIFYRQSDVPEIFELSWILSCFSSKGLMNRAHAYKAAVERNNEAGREPDDGVNIGLFTYPILMASDILLFKSNLVPVGKDQIQHVEIASRLAEGFNKQFGQTFSIPDYVVEDSTAIIPGLDGRKMSKSYDNTIPLFEESTKLRKLINRIKTDSSLPNEPKNPDDSVVFALYQEFASDKDIEGMRERFEHGIGWGDAKSELFRAMDSFLEEPRRKYNYYMSHTDELDLVLEEGARKAREKARPFLNEIKRKLGIRM
ncbi:tryptophan--tRNA ligase [Pseudalkalibacillus hwajinpoensis]|uniref:Tryptophan--tRNA ligase n=1 Tax=Guptibacillus hwajinpoensis TaxID=208199 RepID=A0A4U1MNV0_9BACL|nr:tryptophan--tRNA ligase [Pseudalkalibacillus hwajinpoensis]TKD72446.1 tryptophan--tRNA ligase [Pseudalkalibacillus hwajinpoensis]